jgi:transcriptional regulator with XRE-family HTH domain
VSAITPAPNRLEKERVAAGIARPEELAAKAGIDATEYEHIEAGRPHLEGGAWPCCARGGI